MLPHDELQRNAYRWPLPQRSFFDVKSNSLKERPRLLWILVDELSVAIPAGNFKFQSAKH